MRSATIAVAMAVCVSAWHVAAGATATVSIDPAAPLQRVPPGFLGHGVEMWQWMEMAANLSDPRLAAIASHVSPPYAPATVRVGGITADWVRYVLAAAPDRSPGAPAAAPHGVSAPFWPTAPENLTLAQFDTLLAFANASGLAIVFDLSELYGRDCHWNNTTQCVGEWDISNVSAFLQYLHDAAVVNGTRNATSPLVAFELGNELTRSGHLNTTTNAADVLRLGRIIADMWLDQPTARPPFFAPSTDICDASSEYLMSSMVGSGGLVSGFSFHSYPGLNGSHLLTQLLDAGWLRQTLYLGDPHANASVCVAQWRNLTGAGGGAGSSGGGVGVGAGPTAFQLLLTETNSGYQAPSGVTNAFINGMFYVASLGQLAQTGVSLHARWSLLGGPWPNAFALITANGSRWDVASDFFVAVVHKRAVGTVVLNASTGPDDPVLAYAQCATSAYGGHSGAVALLAVNPSAVAATLQVVGVATTVPRWEWVLTAGPAGAALGNVSTTTPCLNGCTVWPPLRIGEDGSLPAGGLMPALITSGDGGTVTLPPQSQSIMVLSDAGAAACNGP